jgi:hypothetical protein
MLEEEQSILILPRDGELYVMMAFPTKMQMFFVILWVFQLLYQNGLLLLKILHNHLENGMSIKDIL